MLSQVDIRRYLNAVAGVHFLDFALDGLQCFLGVCAEFDDHGKAHFLGFDVHIKTMHLESPIVRLDFV